MQDIRQTPQYAKFLKKVGWKVETLKNVNYFIRNVPILGNVIKIQRPEVIRYGDIEILKKKYHPYQITIEPKNNSDLKILTSEGYKINKSPYLPTKTLQIDLGSSINQIVSSFKKDAKLAIQKNLDLVVKPQENINLYRDSWKKTVGNQRHVPSTQNLSALKKSFGKRLVMYQCFDSGQLLGGATFLIGDSIAYYWSAFTSNAGRQKLAQYKIVLEGIKWAKQNKAKIFDFEGIYDPRFPDKSWKGFSHFKKSFGGLEMEYPGMYSKMSFINIIWK